MRTSRILKIAVSVLIVSMLISGFFVARMIELFSTSGWELFLGQIRLTPDSGGRSPLSYLSQALLLDDQFDEQIGSGRLVVLPEPAYFWGPGYAGFPEARLARDETRFLLGQLREAMLFREQNSQYECYLSGARQWLDCHDAESIHESFLDIQLAGEIENKTYSFQIPLEPDRLAEYRLWQDDGQIAFEVIQPNQSIQYGVISLQPNIMATLTSQAFTSTIPILWEARSADDVNRIAARRLGKGYSRALELLTTSPVLEQNLGPILEIRPALGENWYSSWMDSTQLQLTFFARGETASGAVLMRGLHCFFGELMVQGELIDLFSDPACAR